tara:strand:+ start:431 stop:601 length:171 start_codon:yes stop_codon:yes gene_type:complete
MAKAKKPTDAQSELIEACEILTKAIPTDRDGVEHVAIPKAMIDKALSKIKRVLTAS